MSDTPWTKRPWVWSEDHPTNACATVRAKTKDGWYEDIATLYGGSDDVPRPSMPEEPWGDHPIRRANARLIAAAPDMAEGLPRASEMLRIAATFLRAAQPDGLIFYDEAECDAICIADDCEAAADDIDAALAKARGQAQAEERANG